LLISGTESTLRIYPAFPARKLVSRPDALEMVSWLRKKRLPEFR